MYLSIYGDLSTKGLIQFAREMEEKLLSLPDISLVELRGIRKPEIHIEILRHNCAPGHPSLRYRNRRRQCCSRRPGRFHQDRRRRLPA